MSARYRDMKRDWNKAIQIYQALSLMYPDDLSLGSPAEAQCSAGEGSDALATIAALRKLPPPASRDSRIQLAEARAAESRADFARDSRCVAGCRKRKAHGRQLLVARALAMEGWALDNLGKAEEAVRVDEEAKTAFASVGDEGGVAHALKLIGDALEDEGKYQEAVKAYQESVAIARKIGYQTAVAVALNNLANVFESKGDLPGRRGRMRSRSKCAAQSATNCARLLV